MLCSFHRNIERALKRNILFVSAAGNDGANLSRSTFYPASYSLPNILSVASSDRKNRKVKSSNYGTVTVDVAALGHKIESTLPGGKRGTMIGADIR